MIYSILHAETLYYISREVEIGWKISRIELTEVGGQCGLVPAYNIFVQNDSTQKEKLWKMVQAIDIEVEYQIEEYPFSNPDHTF